MQSQLDQLLETRSASRRTLQRWAAGGVSLLIHAGLVAGLLVAPLLAGQQQPPVDFVRVSVIPAQALGLPEPVSEPPEEAQPERIPPPDPEPTPVQPEPETAKLPEPEQQPPKEKRPRKTTPKTPPSVGSETGSATSKSAFGAAVAGLENPDFVYGYYIDQMLGMIQSHWLRPAIGGGVEVVVHYRIRRNGDISELRITRSSGYSSFDLAALRAVRSAAPFPRLPQGFRHNSLGVNLIVR